MTNKLSKTFYPQGKFILGILYLWGGFLSNPCGGAVLAVAGCLDAFQCQDYRDKRER